MKKIATVFLAVIALASGLSAQDITLKFTGALYSGAYQQLEWVSVEDVSGSWTEILLYPDTVLQLTVTNSIEDADFMEECSMESYPNPFNGKTSVRLTLVQGGDVHIQVLTLSGRKVMEKSLYLDAGESVFDVSLTVPQVYIVCATTAHGRKSVKLINRGGNASNSISYRATRPVDVSKRHSSQLFMLGDVLRIQGFTTISGISYGSAVVEQQQFANEDFTLVFYPRAMMEFSISDDVKVFFSPGNMQWSATGGTNTPTTHYVHGGVLAEGTWRFAPEQWHMIGIGNANIDTNYAGWIDLFGWGTSGLDNFEDPYSNNCNPYSIRPATGTISPSGGFGPTNAYGRIYVDIFGINVKWDWAFYNYIYNPSTGATDPSAIWKTPTIKEIQYLLVDRVTTTAVNGQPGARFTIASIDTNSADSGQYNSLNEVTGLLLFPDDAGNLVLPANGRWGSINDASSTTTCSYKDWRYLESKGCVFLPAAGHRNITDVSAVGSGGCYWSTSSCTVDRGKSAYYLFFAPGQFSLSAIHKCRGFSVRPVREVINPDIPTVNTYAYFTATDTSAYCSGNVANMGVDSVTVRGFCWDTLPFPNLRNSHSVNGSDTGRFSGFVSGLLPGKCYYVRAYASNSAGTGYGEQVLVALYNTNPNPKFGITTYHNARFSPGNLQWNGADTVCNWRFASRQWETIGNASGNNTPDTSRRKTQNAWIDLFGWATSGYHDTADTLNVYYQPYDIEGASIGYGPSEYMPDRNLQGTSANYDWGVLNAISNPATNTIDSVGTWRTPTRDEWYYMFYSRQSATTVNGYSNARFTIAKVDTNINNGFYYDATTTIVAVIVFPDSAGVLNMFGSGSWGRINTYDYRSYTKCSNADWRMLEAAGCVLLPVGGARNVAQVTDQATNGYYWTASSNNNNSIQAHALLFSLTQTRATMGFSSIYRSYGYSVRMISDIIEPRPLVRTDPISDVTDTAVACGGTVLYMGADTIIERGICWDTVMYPTVNGNHVAMGAGMGAFSGSVYGMAQGTVYYVRAYATNSFGTAYGEPKRLKTGVTTPSPRFAVSANSDVRFSPGNLQWSATGGSGVAVTHVVRGGASQPGMWRFATRQWRTVGYYNRLIDTNYYGWTDLLGWGTSGYHNAADTNNVNYMPYSKDVQIQNPTVNLYGYGPSTSMPDTNLVGVSKSYDWGYYNSIYNTKTNSTDSAGTWRVPTQNEWDYLLNTRSVATTVGGTAARYTVAYIDTNATHEYAFDSIFSMCGMIIFPDSAGTLSMFGNGRWGTINGIAVATKCSYLDWKTLEAEGCVFLPAAGVRNGTSVSGLKTVGYYWSSTSDGLANANLLLYNNRMALTTFSVERYMGCSIRLVSDY